LANSKRILVINLNQLTIFITSNFLPEQLFIDRLKEYALIADIDCLKGSRKLTLRATDENVEFSTISKEPELDFSLYAYSLNNQDQVEQTIIAMKKAQKFQFPNPTAD
jgi:predicted ATPase